MAFAVVLNAFIPWVNVGLFGVAQTVVCGPFGIFEYFAVADVSVRLDVSVCVFTLLATAFVRHRLLEFIFSHIRVVRALIVAVFVFVNSNMDVSARWLVRLSSSFQ